MKRLWNSENLFFLKNNQKLTHSIINRVALSKLYIPLCPNGA